jgi:hypothetical protein
MKALLKLLYQKTSKSLDAPVPESEMLKHIGIERGSEEHNAFRQCIARQHSSENSLLFYIPANPKGWVISEAGKILVEINDWNK